MEHIKELSLNTPERIQFEKKPIRTVIISMGPRLSPFAKNVRTLEIFYFRHFLLNFYNRTEVDVATKLLPDDSAVPYFKSIYDIDLNSYDEVIIHNAALNYFGGVVLSYTEETFIKLSQYKGDNIWYYLTDPKLNFTDFGAMFKERMRKKNLKFKTNSISENHCDDFTNNILPKIKLIFTGNNYPQLKKQKETQKNLFKREIFTYWDQIETHEFWAANIVDEFEPAPFPREFDIIYFGNDRQSDRNKVLDSYFKKEQDLKKRWIGYTPKYPNITTSPYLLREDLIKNLNKSYSTFVVGDFYHYNNIKTVRFFEALMTDMVAFVHAPFDGGNYIQNKELRDYIIVNDINELKEKLDKYKNNELLFRKILELQKAEVERICGKYKLSFKLQKEEKIKIEKKNKPLF
jgi:hypothetical protein